MFCAEWRAAQAIGTAENTRAGIARRPFQHLHAAHRSADHAEQVGDAQVIEQCRLGAHHVAHGHHRKAQVPRLAGRRIAGERAGRAHAAAQHIDADDEVVRRIEHLARPDQALPPAFLAGHRMLFGHELVEGQGMADQDGVGLLRIERAVGLVGHPIGAELDAAVEPERALDAQNRVAALGERLPFSLGKIVEFHGGRHNLRWLWAGQQAGGRNAPHRRFQACSVSGDRSVHIRLPRRRRA